MFYKLLSAVLTAKPSLAVVSVNVFNDVDRLVPRAIYR